MNHKNDLNKKECCGNCSCGKNAEVCATVLPQTILDFIAQSKQKDHPESFLIAVLHKVQDHFGYLSEEAMDSVAYEMGIPAAKVSGVASFYHYFRLKPRGKYAINVCLGTACYVKGAENILRKFSDALGIEVGETTGDGLFSLEVSRCLGTCALAPVVKIGDVIHAQVTTDQVPAIIEQYITKKIAT